MGAQEWVPAPELGVAPGLVPAALVQKRQPVRLEFRQAGVWLPALAPKLQRQACWIPQPLELVQCCLALQVVKLHLTEGVRHHLKKLNLQMS